MAEKGARLVVLDSVAALARLEFAGGGMVGARACVRVRAYVHVCVG